MISHKDAKRTHSLGDLEVEEKSEPLGERRSARNVKRVDYKAMNDGRGQLLSVGDTVVSEHMATQDHSEGDIEVKILGF